MTNDLSDLLAIEHAKRDRMWNPVERWRVLQETISWAEKQMPVRRSAPSMRLAEQSHKLEVFRRIFGDAFDATGVGK